jgi:hypothetical protein
MASEPIFGEVQHDTGNLYCVWLGNCWAQGLLREDAERLAAELARGREAVELLRDNQWGHSGGCTYCYTCNQDERDGHAPDCRLAKVIASKP